MKLLKKKKKKAHPFALSFNSRDLKHKQTVTNPLCALSCAWLLCLCFLMASSKSD